MHRTLVLNVVGLTSELMGENTPHLARLAKQGTTRCIDTVTPAVTCSVQSSYVTGLPVSGHGIVGNGWYFRDLSEVWFWRQSNRLVAGEKVWETAKRRDPNFTCAKMFWWYNMYSTADISVTPRPMYPADGRKLPDVYSHPAELRNELQTRFGQFPLFKFWGPLANIESSRWIADAALDVHQRFAPTLNLVYLPHLDYNLQRLGPAHPRIAGDLREIDAECGRLIEAAERDGVRVVVLSEYGITEVSDAVHINRALRDAGLLSVREEMGRELLDTGASRAFAVADHQIAHIYVASSTDLAQVQRIVESLDGVELVLDRAGKIERGLDHPRSGELVAVSSSDRWFSYYYWLDDARAPDFARTVDIHRKPGYDPVELFIDPKLKFAKARIASRLAARQLGFRNLLDVVGLDTTLVRGSHGRPTDRPEQGPVWISSVPELIERRVPGERLPALQVKDLILAHLFDG